MKKYSKAVVIILTVLLLLFSYTAIFGVNRRVGEVNIKLINGLKDINLGNDISGGVEATFSSQQKMNPEMFEEISKNLNARLLNLGVKKSSINVYYNKNSIVLSFKINNKDIKFNKTILENLGGNQSLYFILGDKSDGEIILEGSDFLSAQVESQGDKLPPIIYFELDDQRINDQPSPAERFKELTKSLINEDIPVSVWYKGDFLLNIWVDEVITSGEISIVDPSFTKEFADDLAKKINTKVLPSELTLENYGYSNYGARLSLASALSKAVFVTLLLSCICLVILYRLSGVISSLLMLALTSSMIVIFSGYIPTSSPSSLSILGIFGIIIVVLFSFTSHILLNQRIKEELDLGKSLDGALTSGFNYTNNLRRKLGGVALIIGVLIMAAFDTNNGIIKTLLTPLFFATEPLPNTHIYSFGLALSWGGLINHMLIRFLTLPMINSLSAFHAFKSKTLFGGNTNERE